MTINDPEAFCNGLWDWACLDGCFGETKIKPSDIDGFIERNSKFLAIETKQPGANVPYGQHLMYERMAKTGFCTVMIVWGNPGKPEKIELLTSRTAIIYEPANLDKLREITTKWFEWAENQTPAPRFD
jgi:hypothetical protein